MRTPVALLPHGCDAHIVRQIAVRARRDPRTVARMLSGQAVASTSVAAIEAAMRELGYVIWNGTLAMFDTRSAR